MDETTKKGELQMGLIQEIAVRSQNAWFSLRDEESGQTLVEYALIIALVSIGAIVALGILSGKINDIFGSVSNTLNNSA
jgi:pilus assembly protein Flp/PilA